MEAAAHTTRIHQAELAAEARSDEAWERDLTTGNLPTEEEADARSIRILAEELEARGLTLGDWEAWIGAGARA